jgi:phosphoribosylamine--glycine ligase
VPERVLVVGAGAREHALCWALARSRSAGDVHCAPGNPGAGQVASLHDVDPTDARAVAGLALALGAGLVVVGPEAPLVAGVADALADAGVPVFGPTAAASRIEGSKTFAKQVMEAARVPTARYWSGSDPDDATKALEDFDPPYVVKADGLAAGKGVRICQDLPEARAAVADALVHARFGEAGRRLVIEEFLAGPEVSLFGICDGRTVLPLVPAQDFKRAYDGDVGPNTGGMGAYSPVPAVDPLAVDEIARSVLQPVVTEMARRGAPFTGVLYAGLVLTSGGPRVLEFNARFGDPEAQVVLPRLRSDLAGLLSAAAQGALASVPAPVWDERACVTVVLASGGYPGSYETGKPVSGLAEAAAVPGAVVFHAGTRTVGGEVVTAGGRVLSVSGLGAGIAEARAVAYEAAARIRFDGLQRRDDIAARPAS